MIVLPQTRGVLAAGGERDPFFANVVFLSHVDTTGWIDVIGHTPTAYNSPANGPGEYGNCLDCTAAAFDGVKWAPSGSEFNLDASTEYAIEFSIYNTNWAATAYLFDMHPGPITTDSSKAILIYTLSSAVRLWNGSDFFLLSVASLGVSNNTWHKMALVRTHVSGTNYTSWFVDGVQKGFTATSTNFVGPSVITFGRDTDGTLGCVAKFDELRVTIGARRYTGGVSPVTYTPATEPFPNS